MLKQFEDAIETLRTTSFQADNVNSLFTSSPNYTALLKTNDTVSKSIKLDKKERAFKSQELNYISTIFLYTDNLPNAKQAISLNYINVKGDKVAAKIQVVGNFAFTQIKAFTDNFEISFSGSGVRPKIQKILINGLESKKLQQTKDQIAEFLSASISIDETIKRLKQDYITKQESLEIITSQIADQEVEVTKGCEDVQEIKSELVEVTAQLTRQQIELNKAIAGQTSASNEETAKRNSIVQLTEQESALNKEIVFLKSQLDRLQHDKEIISDEFIDYIKEGKSQARTYMGAAVLGFFIIGLCVALLFNGASNLLQATYQSANDVFAAFALRLPFAGVLSGVIIGAGALVKYLINRTVHINEERLTLAKLLVIAKDTVNSATDKLALSDDQRLNARVRLKIDLLKSHLTAELGKSPSLQSFEPETTSSNAEPSAPKEEKKEEPWV